jgi:hypothetical protein
MGGIAQVGGHHVTLLCVHLVLMQDLSWPWQQAVAASGARFDWFDTLHMR